MSFDEYENSQYITTESIQSCSHFGASNLSNTLPSLSYIPGTRFYLTQVKHLRVKGIVQGHDIETMSQDWEGRDMIFP